MTKPKKKKPIAAQVKPTLEPEGTDWDARIGEWVGRSRPFLPFVVVAGAVTMAMVRGTGAGVLVIAGAALVVGITLLWTSVRLLVGDAPVDLEAAVAMGDAADDDAHKRRILQALKDLDNEHRLGKLTEVDYKELSARYRVEAKEVLRAIDARLEPARKKAALEVEEAASLPPPVPKEKSEEEGEDGAEEAVACSKCETKNDPDAAFCKKCGEKLSSE